MKHIFAPHDKFFLLSLFFTLQGPQLSASESKIISVAVEAPDLIEIPTELKYLGVSLAKNLCAGIVKEEIFMLTGCGVKRESRVGVFTVVSSIRAEAQQLLFETSIRNEKGTELASTKTHSGSERYHGLTLESHSQKVLSYLRNFETSEKPTQAKAVSEITKPVSNGDQKHDGFYFNTTAGLGWMKIDSGIEGLPAILGIKLGAAVSEHFVLFGAVDYGWLQNPKIDASVLVCANNSCKTQKISGNMDGHIGHLSSSAGFTYYSDANYLIQFSIGLAGLMNNFSATGYNSKLLPDVSTIFNLAIGKEWWVSKEWGVGIAILGLLAPGFTTGTSVAYSFVGIGVTATYN